MSKTNLNMQYTRAQIAPNSYNKETRTFDVVFVTETPCPAWNYEVGGEYNEILSCDPQHVRMQRASQGLPVFDSHYPRTAMVQLGRASNIRFENGQGKATITLGARADEALISDIENGILSGISVGYNVHALRGESIIAGQTPTYRAVDWEPGEISFAPVQADPNSGIRDKSNSGHYITIINPLKQAEMKKMRCACGHEFESDQTRAACPECGAFTETRADSGHPQPKTEPDMAKIREQASKEEKIRIDAILLSTRAAKLSDTEAIEFIQSTKTIEEIRQAVIEKYVASESVKPNGDNTIGLGKEAIEKKREAAAQAILHRISPKVFKLEDVQGSRDFRGLAIHEIAKELAHERGANVRMIGKFDMADKVFGSQRDMSTSDFPLLLENVMNKSLRADYAYAPEFWDKIAAETSVADFRAKSLYQVDSVNGMQEVAEGDELKYGKLVEAKQSIKVKSFGEGLQFTRQMFVNDDLSAFSKIPSKFVLDWNTTKGDLIWAMITGNVVMGDSVAMFHANHKNLATGVGSVLSDDGLTDAVKLFKAQTGLDGKRKIRVLPKYLIVSPDLETTALKLLFNINPNVVSAVNIWANQFELIVEPRLSGNAWYLAADPSQIDGLYYAHMNGNSGLRSMREDNFKTDSIDFMVRGEFGVAAIDYRGWVKSVGA